MNKKIAIVTGASSGLGAEFARQLDKKEALDEIWVIARRRERLEALARMVKTSVRVMPLDLTKQEALEEFSCALDAEKPRVKVLVNAAGFGKIGSFREISRADSERMIDLNCKAAVSVTERALPYMGKGDRILEICSTAAFQPFPYLNVYAATKAFLYRYSRALRVELRASGVRVTAVCPYWVKDTEFIGSAKETKDSGAIRNFPLASGKKSVVSMALNDSRLNLAVSTPGSVCAVHRIAAKFIPHSLMMGIWELLRRV